MVKMVQIIYSITSNDGIVLLDSMHGAGPLAESMEHETAEIKAVHDECRPKLAPHKIEILHYFTSESTEALEQIWKEHVVEYFKQYFDKNCKMSDLLSDPKYVRSSKAVQTEIGMLAVKNMYGNVAASEVGP